MNYSLNIGEWNSVFAVPSSVVDKYIKLASADALKLLLFLLRHGGHEYPAEKLKNELGFTESGELEDAALFWIQRGVIRYDNENSGLSAVREASELSEKNSVPVGETEYVQQTIDDIAPKKTAEPPVKTTPARVSSGEIASRIKDSSEIKMLFDEAEKIYGRPLKQRDNQTLIALVDHYGLSAGVSLMLLKYCFKVGKKSPNYIETTAAGWSADGIDSIEKANERILALERSSDLEHRLRKEFGIPNEFTPKQKVFLRTWLDDWDFSEEMIKLALNIAIENTGNPAINYTNGILENWRLQNIKTPEDAEASDYSKAKTKTKAGAKPKSDEGAFDVNDIMSRIISNYNN